MVKSRGLGSGQNLLEASLYHSTVQLWMRTMLAVSKHQTELWESYILRAQKKIPLLVRGTSSLPWQNCCSLMSTFLLPFGCGAISTGMSNLSHSSVEHHGIIFWPIPTITCTWFVPHFLKASITGKKKKNKKSLISYSFIPQILTECLPCARHVLRCQRHKMNQAWSLSSMV